MDAKAMDMKPLDMKPMDMKPLDMKPPEMKPPDVKPLEMKPVELGSEIPLKNKLVGNEVESPAPAPEGDQSTQPEPEPAVSTAQLDLESEKVKGTNENIINNETSQCLVCFNRMDPTLSATGNSQRLPADQLYDLFKVFQISFASIEHVLCKEELPLKLFCSDCTGRILDAVGLLFQIQRLQDDFKVTKDILQRDIMSTWLRTYESENSMSINHVRKMLVQCFSSCSVLVDPASIKPPPRKRALRGRRQICGYQELDPDFDALDDGFLKLLSPVTVLTPGFPRKKRPRERGGTTSQESDTNDDGGFSEPEEVVTFDDAYQPSDPSEGEVDVDELDGNYEPKRERVKRPKKAEDAGPPKKKRGRPKKIFPFSCEQCGKGFMSENFLSLHLASHEKRIAAQEKKSRKSSKTRTRSSAGLSTSTDRVRKRKRIKRSIVAEGGPQGNASFKYDDNNAVIGFECPICKKEMSRSDFQTDSGDFIFKCDWDSCDKTTSTFSNLTYHHQTHCSNRPRKPKWKSSKWKSAYRLMNKIKYVTATGPPRSENGREYDTTGRIIGFDCPRCDKKITYADYIDTETRAYIFKCFPSCCDKIFTTFPNLVFHHEARCSPTDRSTTVSKYDGEGKLESFLCLICNETFQSSQGSEGSFKCHLPECGQIFNAFQGLHSHHQTHCMEKLKENGVAVNTVYSIKHRKIGATGLMKHSTRQKKGKIFEFVCELCGKGYDRKVSFEEHLKCHEGFLAYECKFCHRKFSNEANLVKHARHHELAKEQRCTKPERMLQPSRKQFCPEGNLASYHCQHCDKVINKADCVKGTGEHENEYRCWLSCCDRNFIHFTAMVVHHVANCPSRKPSVCEVCGRSFPTTWKMRIHYRDSHLKLDPLYCDQCGKAFGKKVDLIRHMVTHSDDKPFACALCPCKYKRRKNLKIHMRLHNDERPYMCSTCGKTFRSVSNLNEHEKAHGMEHKFPCSFCSQVFKNKHDVDLHVAQFHEYPTSSAGNGNNHHHSGPGSSSSALSSQLMMSHKFDDGPSHDSGSGSYEVQDYSSNRGGNNLPLFFPTGFNWK